MVHSAVLVTYTTTRISYWEDLDGYEKMGVYTLQTVSVRENKCALDVASLNVAKVTLNNQCVQIR